MSADTSTRSGLPRILQVTLTLAALVVVLLGIKQVGSFVGPLFLGLNLMLVAAPLYGALTRRGVPRVLASVTTVLGVYAFLVVFIWSLWWSISVLITELPAYQGKFTDLYEQSLGLLGRFGVSETMLADQVSAIDPNKVVDVLSSLVKGVGDGLTIVAIVVTVLVFLSMDTIGLRERIMVVAELHPSVADALTGFGEGIRRYWVVTTVFGLIVAAIDVVALWIIGVPFALVWGVLSFVTNYIPNIGFLLGLIPPTLIALLDDGVPAAIAVVVVYSIANFVMQSLIQPKYAGDAVGVTPTMSFFSLLLWAWVFGPTGALLALPATLLLKSFLVDVDPAARWVNALISSRPEQALGREMPGPDDPEPFDPEPDDDDPDEPDDPDDPQGGDSGAAPEAAETHPGGSA